MRIIIRVYHRLGVRGYSSRVDGFVVLVSLFYNGLIVW